MKTNCVQVRQSIRPNRAISCLGANMKDYATCEQCMDHSLRPRLREYLFEVANALLTLPITDGNLAGNPILLQLETKKKIKGNSSTHRKGFENNEINT